MVSTGWFLLQKFSTLTIPEYPKPVNIGRTHFMQGTAPQNKSFMTAIPFTDRQIDMEMNNRLQQHLNNSQPRTAHAALSRVTKDESKQSLQPTLEG
jgi:hypothetical protein